MSRDASYQLEVDKLRPENLYIGDKALVYIYAYNFNVYNNFWWAEEETSRRLKLATVMLVTAVCWWLLSDVGDRMIILVTFLIS